MCLFELFTTQVRNNNNQDEIKIVDREDKTVKFLILLFFLSEYITLCVRKLLNGKVYEQDEFNDYNWLIPIIVQLIINLLCFSVMFNSREMNYKGDAYEISAYLILCCLDFILVFTESPYILLQLGVDVFWIWIFSFYEKTYVNKKTNLSNVIYVIIYIFNNYSNLEYIAGVIYNCKCN